MRRSLLALATTAALTLAACSSDEEAAEETTTEGSGEIVTLTVGASPVPHADILAFIDENLAEEAGIDLEIVEYSDYVLPNRNLDSGELDANFFQHVPYFNVQVEENGYDFEHGEGVHIEPYAVYSDTLTSLDELEDGAKVSIVNDPSNQARALWLLEDNGIITLDESVENPTIFDVVDNPKNIEFVELEAPNLPRTLDQVSISIINGNFALEGGLVPSEDAIAIESGEGNPYANVLAWKAGSDKADAIQILDGLLRTQEVADFITETYPDGEVIPAF
ncbi:MetQ/NlpA family ABC transporter substrate-binding protein [Flaviflexus equikiangi]|uniref:Lipoprotein n=1 Tax=Flaviflexus equikiangi TaxID=2758573 RepID=A0ABS2TGL6_9ACTO|nr:MetQ/NlpA family ABC transporter substrate-binding protein [Flaviflexus equikiangi]MBM9433790.1 MetQ/NlpA family ABC transporter substrate-binding protein [Flaviflexus equikiangi]